MVNILICSPVKKTKNSVFLDNLVEETYEEVVNLAVASGAFVLAEEIDRLRGRDG